MDKPRTLQCGVVGAGIAGLAASIALTKAGHEVEIFERSRFKNEIGAAITLSPNANLVLEHWGFDFKAAGETAKRQHLVLDWSTLQVQHRVKFDEVQEKFGHAFNAFHRVDLHREMRKIAEGNLKVKIVLGSGVTAVDCQSGTMTLENGRTVQKDLVVIADGIRSSFIETITGRDIPFTQTDRSAFRTIIPIDRLMADKTARLVFENEASGFISSNLAKDRFFITYPCRNDTLMNIAIVHPKYVRSHSADVWSAAAPMEDVMEVIKDAHPFWQAVAEKADSFDVYHMEHRNGVDKMANGKACLIGDAAHAMLPTYGQGGCMALEDAASLEVLMANLEPGESVEKRLKLFEQLRLPRCAVTQSLSNRTWAKDSTAFQKALEVKINGTQPPKSVQGFEHEWRDFFYWYNAYEEAEKALKYKDEWDGIPDGALKFFGPP